jgi:hypothetical protein
MVSQELLLDFPEADRLLITQEAMADPAFGDQLSQILSLPGGPKAVALSMRQSVANEMDSRLYPGSKGMWPVLRKTVVELAGSMPGIIDKELERLPLETLTAMLTVISEGKSPFFFTMYGMGAEASAGFGWGSLISTVIDSATSLYNRRVANATAVRVANLQASSAAATERAQLAIANAQQAIANAGAVQAEAASPASILTKDIGGGIPFWTIPTVILMVGVGIFLALKFRRQ